MSYAITGLCVKCNDMPCIGVCPVTCFYEGQRWLAISPEQCIDCGACVPVCPTTAIFYTGDLPIDWMVYEDINAVVSGARSADDVDLTRWPAKLKAQVPTVSTWPVITDSHEAMPGTLNLARTDGNPANLDLTPATR
jgi:ferredoxin